MISSLPRVFDDFDPKIVLVHGDTASTLATTIAAFYSNILVGHVEAGLRTGDLKFPWPEEGNRKLVGAIANLHFLSNIKKSGKPFSRGRACRKCICYRKYCYRCPKNGCLKTFREL